MSDIIVELTKKLAVSGFLETRALLYMDIMILFLSILPLFFALSIFFAMRGYYRVHKATQIALFLVSIAMLGFFAYIVHYQHGFDTLLLKSSIAPNQATLFLVVHIIIALTTVILWFFTLMYGIEDSKRRALPGVYSQSHKRSGRRVFLGIFLTSLSSIALYWLFFVS